MRHAKSNKRGTLWDLTGAFRDRQPARKQYFLLSKRRRLEGCEVFLKLFDGHRGNQRGRDTRLLEREAHGRLRQRASRQDQRLKAVAPRSPRA